MTNDTNFPAPASAPQPPTPVAAGAPAATPARKGAMRFVTPALALVAVLGLGIFGGVLIGQNTAGSAQASGSGMPGGQAQAGFGGGDGPDGAMGGITSGTVVSVDGDTMVVESSDGTQVTVSTTSDTAVTATSDTTLDTLVAGDSVTVVGEADDSGDVAATSVSEGAMTGFPGGGNRGAAPTDDTATD